MFKSLLAAAIAASAIAASALSAGSAAAEPASYRDPLTSASLDTVRERFMTLMDAANRHDLTAIHDMFWQSPSALLVAKGATPAEGNWAGFWGNPAVDQKLHDIANSGPVVLRADYAKLKVVGLAHDVAETYAPLIITVSYAGQDGTPKPFLLIIDWKQVGTDWKIASEIILPVPPAPVAKG
jgi:hypothetical protein